MDRELKQIIAAAVITAVLGCIATVRGEEVIYTRGPDNVFRAPTETIEVGTNNPRFPVLRAVGETAKAVAQVPGRILCPT